MHKFFCTYNHLTEKYELSLNKNYININNKSKILAENNLLPKIKNLLQQIYSDLVVLKEKNKEIETLEKLDKCELMLSNLYYSFFSSPFELIEIDFNNTNNDKEILNSLTKNIDEIISIINIPEYNRLCLLIKNNIDQIYKSIN